MTKTNVAVIYYSSTGTNYELAKWAEAGAREAGADVKVLKVPELAPAEAIDSNPAWREHYDATKDVPEATSDDLEWADAIIFSAPTRFGNVPAQMKQYIDMQGGLWATGKTVNKVVSAMSSAQNPDGGQEATILALYTSMMNWGAVIAAPGYSDARVIEAGGNPYGTSVTDDKDGKMVRSEERRVGKESMRA